MSLKAKVPLWKKIVWRWVAFPLLALLILGAGTVFYIAGGNDSKPAAIEHVLVVDDAAKAKSTMEKIQAAAKAGKPVFMEICDGEFCAEQLAELDKLAGEYKDKMLFIAVKPSMVAPMLPKIAQSMGGPLAYPLHVIDTGKAPVAIAGILTKDQLKELVELALKLSSGQLSLESLAPNKEAPAAAPADSKPSVKTEGETAPAAPQGK